MKSKAQYTPPTERPVGVSGVYCTEFATSSRRLPTVRATIWKVIPQRLDYVNFDRY